MISVETPPVKQARRAMHLHAQVIVAMTNRITTARAMAPWFFPLTLYRVMPNQLGGHLAYLQSMLGFDGLLLNANCWSYLMCSCRNRRQLAVMLLGNRRSCLIDRLINLRKCIGQYLLNKPWRNCFVL